MRKVCKWFAEELLTCYCRILWENNSHLASACHSQTNKIAYYNRKATENREAHGTERNVRKMLKEMLEENKERKMKMSLKQKGN